jgi:hypothetical protein
MICGQELAIICVNPVEGDHSLWELRRSIKYAPKDQSIILTIQLPAFAVAVGS